METERTIIYSRCTDENFSTYGIEVQIISEIRRLFVAARSRGEDNGTSTTLGKGGRGREREKERERERKGGRGGKEGDERYYII